MPSTTNLTDRVQAWIAADPDPDTRDELAELVADPSAAAAAELADRFDGKLEFGTAGLRGRLGGGPNRMNRVVVRRAAAGLVRFLQRDLGLASPLVVIGYDARHKSEVFAHDSAAVITAAGGRAALLPRALPTPVLAFSVRHLGADAGVMVTASHNPPADNGYKVYLGDGAQIVPPIDTHISAAIDGVAEEEIPLAAGGWDLLGDDMVDAYVDQAFTAVPGPPGRGTPRPLRIVYTPMHGVGRDVALALLARAGFPDVHVVESQAEPDPDFPTVLFPNPEEPGALDNALALARERCADVVIANDPDADRLAVCVRDPLAGGDFRPLTGNEVGALLADHLLAATADVGATRLVATSIVSSRLLAVMAAAAGVAYMETLTGFKWIMRAAVDHPELAFVFGFEEALGYAVTDLVRDKDGITAAMAFAELAHAAKAAGRTVADRLEDIARRFGLHATAGFSIPVFGVPDRILADPPGDVAGRRLVAVTDLRDGAGGLPPTEGVVLELDGGARAIVRPSGTEPKTKVYLEVVLPVPAGPDAYAAARARASAELDALAAALRSRLAP